MMGEKPEILYLDLMKKTLTFSLWPEPPVPIDTMISEKPPFKKLMMALFSHFTRFCGYQLVVPRVFTTDERENGRIWPGYADTMVGIKRLDNLQESLETIMKEGIEGDLIETGVWRGGASIFMRAVLGAYAVADRKVYVADSFEGLPKPDQAKFPADKGDKHHLNKYLAVSQEQVEENFRKYGLLDGQVIFLKGWFKDTLPKAPIERLALLRLDGDMYGSTMDALTNLYPKLSKGGFCIIDDYALDGCKRAVHDFRAENKITTEIQTVDWTCRFWRKE